MPDITMCQNEKCPKKHCCKRACAMPSEHQYYDVFDFKKRGKMSDFQCDHFIPVYSFQSAK